MSWNEVHRRQRNQHLRSRVLGEVEFGGEVFGFDVLKPQDLTGKSLGPYSRA